MRELDESSEKLKRIHVNICRSSFSRDSKLLSPNACIQGAFKHLNSAKPTDYIGQRKPRNLMLERKKCVLGVSDQEAVAVHGTPLRAF